MIKIDPFFLSSAGHIGIRSARSITGAEGALTVRNNEGTLSKVMESAAGQFLQSRTFRGLEQNIGGDEPSVLEQGRSGIAKGYGELTLDDGAAVFPSGPPLAGQVP